MDDFYVYRYVHIDTGRCYVGKGRSTRATQHRCPSNFTGKSCPKFYNAVGKYGWGAFRLEFIHTGLSNEDALRLEKDAIIRFDSRANGFNITEGGEGPRHSEESKAKIAAAHLGRPKNPEAIARGAATRRGRPCHPNTIAAAHARKGYKRTAESVELTAAAHRGMKRSAETREKIADAASAFTRAERANMTFLLLAGARIVDIADWFGAPVGTVQRLRVKVLPSKYDRFTRGMKTNVLFLALFGATKVALAEWFQVSRKTVAEVIYTRGAE